MFIDTQDDPNAPGPSSGPHLDLMMRPDLALVAERHAAKASRKGRKAELEETVRLALAEIAELGSSNSISSASGQSTREYKN